MRSRPQRPSVQQLYESFKSKTNANRSVLTDKSPFESLSEGRAEDPELARRSGRIRGANLGRHARKCAICNHPDCDSIESDFVNWRSETTIAINYLLPSRSSVYRHAAATGLLERRRANLRGVCERIIERVGEAPPSGMVILRALRIYSQITEDGHWVEPPKRSLVTHIHVTTAEPQSFTSAPSGLHSDVFVGAPSAERGTKEEVAGAPSSAPCAEGGIISAPDLDYLPHWARGVYSDTHGTPAAAQDPSLIAPNTNRENDLDASTAHELLTGTQNGSRESACHGKRSR